MAKTTKVLIPIFLSLLLLVMGCAKKPPMLGSITPSSGPSGGGTSVTIRIAAEGQKFKEGATVTIGGKSLSITISEDGITATGVTPGGAPGAQQVIAENLKAKEKSNAITFTYEPLAVTSTMPADGAQLPWTSRDTTASATLSQEIQAGSASIAIGGVDGSVSYDASSKTVTFAPGSPLRTTQSYTVTVSGATDKAGNVIAPYTFGFSIGEPEKVDWYTVQEGDTLPIIAAKPEVYEDESKEAWMSIYEYNQDEYVSEDGKQGNDAILDYQNLRPGMVLYIPR